MGGKHYYCDYCNRSFKDAAGVRKKHLISAQHIKNRDNHYKQFKEPKQILQEEFAKRPCKRFLSNGECLFGDVCKYSHYTPTQIQQLQALDAESERKKEWTFPDPEFVVKEFFDKVLDPIEMMEQNLNPWPLPDELKDDKNLPPSMRPMTLKDFSSAKFPEWGDKY